MDSVTAISFLFLSAGTVGNTISIHMIVKAVRDRG